MVLRRIKVCVSSISAACVALLAILMTIGTGESRAVTRRVPWIGYEYVVRGFTPALPPPYSGYDHVAEMPGRANLVVLRATSNPVHDPNWTAVLRNNNIDVVLFVEVSEAQLANEAGELNSLLSAIRQATDAGLLTAAGYPNRVKGVQLEEEWYSRAVAGSLNCWQHFQFLGVQCVSPGGPNPAPNAAQYTIMANMIRDAMSAATPVIQQYFPEAVAIMSEGFFNDQQSIVDQWGHFYYKPFPPGMHVGAVWPYMRRGLWQPNCDAAMKAYFDQEVTQYVNHFLINYPSKLMMLVGQSFDELDLPEEQRLWSPMPLPCQMTWTYELAQSDARIVALQWFMWGSPNGVRNWQSQKDHQQAIFTYNQALP